MGEAQARLERSLINLRTIHGDLMHPADAAEVARAIADLLTETTTEEVDRMADRLELCDRMKPYAEKLRDMADAALRYSGQTWRSVDMQVTWITAMFADAVEDELRLREKQHHHS